MRAFSRLFVALCCAWILASCGSSENDRDALPSATPPPTALPAPQPLTLWHALDGAEADALQTTAANFNRAHPAIALEMQAFDPDTLPDAFADAVDQGAGPDLVLGDPSWLAHMAETGRLRMLSRGAEQAVTDALPLAVAPAALLPNGMAAAPYSLTLPALYYNRPLVAEPPASLDDLIAAAEAHGLLLAPDLWAALALDPAFAAQVAAAHSFEDVSGADLRAFLETLASLAASPGVTVTDDITAFTGGEAGLLLATSAEYGALHAALGVALGTAPPVYTAAGAPEPLFTARFAALNLNDTRESAAAAETFILYLLSPEAQRVWFTQTEHAPANVVAIESDAVRAAWAEALRSAHAAPFAAAFYDEGLPALQAAVRAVLQDGTEPEAVADPLAEPDAP